jgi:hypothetical protein
MPRRIIDIFSTLKAASRRSAYLPQISYVDHKAARRTSIGCSVCREGPA